MEPPESPREETVTVPRPRVLQKENLVFIPSAGKLPPPDILAMYAAIDPDYPAFLRETFTAELERNFIFQMSTWIGAILFASLLVCSATFLAYTEHPKIASAIVGVNLIGVVGKLLGKSKRGASDKGQE
jgi:hypothetical protein